MFQRTRKKKQYFLFLYFISLIRLYTTHTFRIDTTIRLYVRQLHKHRLGMIISNVNSFYFVAEKQAEINNKILNVLLLFCLFFFQVAFCCCQSIADACHRMVYSVLVSFRRYSNYKCIWFVTKRFVFKLNVINWNVKVLRIVKFNYYSVF